MVKLKEIEAVPETERRDLYQQWYADRGLNDCISSQGMAYIEKLEEALGGWVPPACVPPAATERRSA